MKKARFTEEQTLEGFDWDAPITFDRDRVRQLFSLAFLEAHEDAIFMGPVGVGKTHLAAALGHAACRVDTLLFTGIMAHHEWQISLSKPHPAGGAGAPR